MTSSAINTDSTFDTLMSRQGDENLVAALNEFELALIRAHNGLDRWQQQSFSLVGDVSLSGAESALLHIVRMNDRAKSIKELARLTNRDDIPNIQYSLRKLASANLVSKSGSGRTGVTYSATPKGVRLTDEHLANRRALLMSVLEQFSTIVDDLDVSTSFLNRVTAVFDETVRNIAARR